MSIGAPPPPASASPPAPPAPEPPKVEEPKPEPPQRELKAPSGGGVQGSKVTIPGNIVYDTGKATIKEMTVLIAT